MIDNDTAMVLITMVYVIATIILVWESNRTNKLTKEQIRLYEEERKETIRPRVTVNFTIVDGVIVLRISNEGNRTAEKVNISWAGELAENSYSSENIQKRYFNIVPGTYWDLMVKPLTVGYNFKGNECTIKIQYEYNRECFEEYTTVNLGAYDWVFLRTDIQTRLDQINDTLKKMQN